MTLFFDLKIGVRLFLFRNHLPLSFFSSRHTMNKFSIKMRYYIIWLICIPPPLIVLLLCHWNTTTFLPFYTSAVRVPWKCSFYVIFFVNGKSKISTQLKRMHWNHLFTYLMNSTQQLHKHIESNCYDDNVRQSNRSRNKIYSHTNEYLADLNWKLRVSLERQEI